MRKTTNKVVLVGSGLVGQAFMISAITQGIAEELAIIDINQDLADGNKLDLEDAFGGLPYGKTKITSGGYEQVKDADVVVITAGRPQREGETRLDMVADNAKIMKSVAENIKSNGFEGVTIIAANPVDVMTTVYQHVTGFDPKTVLSSSCTLDTSRLREELANVFGFAASEFGAFVVGEHGDSSVPTLEYGTVRGIPLKQFYAEKGLGEQELKDLHTRVFKKAYEIINRKGSTYFGIGTALAEVTKAILKDERKIFATGALLSGEYGQEGVYAGVPCLIGKGGIITTYEFPLSDAEKEGFAKSVETLKGAWEKAKEAIS